MPCSARHHFIRPKDIQIAVKAVLLVGGMGTRLRPLTYRLPKPLVPVLGKPLMMHVIDKLPKEVDELIVPVSYKKEMMEEYITKNHPPKKVTLVDEPEALGTGGAVKNVEKMLDSGTFLVINGDSIWSLDIAKFIEFHRRKKAFVTISLWPVEDITGYGVVDIDSEQRIRRFQEKPKKEEAFSNMINAGVYALEHEALGYIGKGFVSMEREVFPKVLDKGMYGFEFGGYWVDCGKRENLLEAFWTLMGESISVDKKAVHDGARIIKPAIVRENAVVAGAIIGPRAYISERAVVGLQSKVEGSVVLEDARIGARCLVIDSIVDAGVTVQDGTEVRSTILSNAKEPGKR